MPPEGLILHEKSYVTCYSLQFAYLARSAAKHYRNKTDPAVPALTAFLKAYKGCRQAIIGTCGKQSKCVSMCERERFFEYVLNFLYVKFTVWFCTLAEIPAFI